MRLIADAVLEICKREELTTRKRYLSAWGTVEQSGRGWIYRWHATGLPALLSTGRACITPCLSQDAAWELFGRVVQSAVCAQKEPLRPAGSDPHHAGWESNGTSSGHSAGCREKKR